MTRLLLKSNVLLVIFALLFVFGAQSAAARNHSDNFEGAAAYFDDLNFSTLASEHDISFLNPTSYAVGRSPNGITTADFNHDGISDLAVVNTADNTFSYLQGNGDGTFRPPVNFSMSGAAGASPVAITAADFNGDGNIDLAVTHPSSTSAGFGNTVTIHLGDGAGNFTAPGTVFTTGGSDTDITSGDFNEDGKVDLAIGACDQQSVFIHPGNGDGTFRPATQTFVGGCGGGSLLSVTAADLNKDSHLDLVASGIGNNTISVLLGNGAGGFGQPKVSSVDHGPAAVVTGDFNHDGNSDLAVAATTDGVVTTLSGDGTGNFVRNAGFNAGSSPLDVRATDFNGDGQLDLLVTNTQSNGISVLPGLGNGQFNQQLTFPAGNSPSMRAAVADYNHDGLPDVAVTNNQAGTVSILLNSSIRTLRTVRAIDTSAAPGSQVSVVIQLTAQGNESGLSFSLNYDPAVLSAPQAALGNDAGGAALQTNSSQTAQGRFGLLVAFPGGQTFAPGTRQVLHVKFQVAQTQATSTTVSFVDQPTLRGVSDANGNLLAAAFAAASITITPGFEADVAPRPNGNNNGTVNVGDFVQMGRFAVGMDTPATGSEFQRADCAPRSTKGDGQINVGDFVQAGRYAVGLDPVVAANGPTSPVNAAASSQLITIEARAVRVTDVSAPSGTEVSISVELEAQGDESGMSFSLDYDPLLLSDPRVVPGSDTVNAALQANLSQTAQGHLGVLVGFLGGQTFPVGARQIAVVTFKLAQTQVPSTIINLGNQPTARAVSDANGVLLPAAFNHGTITIDPNLGNSLDDPRFFVRQQYFDFLNRAPDESGLNFWTSQIDSCGSNQQCAEVRRINVSAAFFLSIEFQNTGYLVYRLHAASFNTGERLPMKIFLSDTQEIGRGFIVGEAGWEQKLESNKQAFLDEFVTRPEFMARYPQTLTPAQFVDALNTFTSNPSDPTAGGALTQTERDQLAADLSSGVRSRAQVLRVVAENVEFQRRLFNRAFVYMQYIGYLHRNPNDLPDTNFDGYNFWLQKLNQFNGNFVQAEMVKAFISSTEYRRRFGP